MRKSDLIYLFFCLICGIALIASCGDDSEDENQDDDDQSSDEADDDDGDSSDDQQPADDDDNEADDDSSNPTDDDDDAAIGAFQVRLAAPVAATETAEAKDGYTSVVGKVYDGPTPEQLIWEEAAAEGDCRLLKPRVPFCEQPCGGSVCVEDDTCQDYPTAQSVGLVTVTGLQTESGEDSFVMEPIANNYQPPGDAKLLYPAFSEGGEIEFSADGGDFVSAFTLKAKGISQLEILNETIPVEKGNPVVLTWTPAGQSDISSIHVKLDISHHGGSKGKIECKADDNGSLEISSSLIGQLTDLGFAGFPTIVVTRSSTGSAEVSAGGIDLVISSQVEKAVQIPGLDSCNDDGDCPDGQTCQTDLVCR